jgi:hypothetical protein
MKVTVSTMSHAALPAFKKVQRPHIFNLGLKIKCKTF